jgi:alpha-tubulin suppressor-like RCC1 family protein
LGTGTASDVSRILPAQVPGLTSFTAIAAGEVNAFGLRSNGTVWAWGSNEYGQLGTGAGTSAVGPSQIPGLTGVTAMFAGSTCFALRNDGTLWGWGHNERAQVGSGSSSPAVVTKPVLVKNLTSVVAAASGFSFSLALRSDGTVWTWGDNYGGQLGIGTTPSQVDTPVQIPGLSDITAIAACDFTAFALRKDGTVWTWGEQPPDFLFPPDGKPIQIASLDGVKAIATSGWWAMALRQDGTVWSWGSNEGGQVGNGRIEDTPVLTPQRNLSLPSAWAISAGPGYGFALVGDQVWGWGDNSSGQLGKPHVRNYLTPMVISR